MTQFRYETHAHTSEASACATSTASEMVQAYYEAGYSGMFITDHFFNGNSAVDPSLPWKERVKSFFMGYNNALEAAEDLDFDVFLGWEYGYDGTEFLTYALTEDFIYKNEDILSWSIEHYFDEVHKAGGFIVHAHPFRERFYIKEIRLFTSYVDAVEVINGGNEDAFNVKAKKYAEENHLPQTQGSDSHHVSQILGGGMVFDQRIRTAKAFIKAISEG